MVVNPTLVLKSDSADVKLRPFDTTRYTVHKAPPDGDCGYHAFLRSMEALYPSVPVPRDARALRNALLKSIRERHMLPREMRRREDVLEDTRARIQSGLDEPGTGWMENDEMEMLANLFDVCIAVWSVAFRNWVFSLPSKIPTHMGGLGGCERVVYMYNTDGSTPNKASSSPRMPAVDYSRASGFHYDYLLPIESSNDSDPEGSRPSTADTRNSSEEGVSDMSEDEDEEPISMEDGDGAEDLVDDEVVEKVEGMSVVKRFAFFKQYIKEFEASKSFVQRKRMLNTAAEMKPVLRTHRIAQHPEYYVEEGKIDASKRDPGAFFYTKKQRFLKKFLSMNTDNRVVLLFHDVGVGKTCSSILMAENFVGMFDRPVLVLLPNSLEHNYKKELFDDARLNFEARTYEACNGAKYLEDIPNWHLSSRKEVRRKVHKMIKSEYTFSGYLKIVNLVRRLKRKAKLAFRDDPEGRELFLFGAIREKFSNRVIVIDEIHNIRLSNDKSMKAFPKTLELILWCAENVRLVMLSATPMFDHPEELSWLMRFAYLADKRHRSFGTDIVFDSEDALTEDSKKRVAYFAKNYVSYMSGYDPDRFGLKYFAERAPERAPGVDMVTKAPYALPVKKGAYDFYSTEMRGYQLRMYRKIAGLTDGDADADEDTATDFAENDRKGNDVHNAVQISNIAYPVPEAETKGPAREWTPLLRGERGFKNNFRVTSEKKAMRVEYMDPDAQFLHPKHLRKYASKMHEIVQHVKRCEGLVLVYSKYIFSGLVPLAVALEHEGFVKYNKNSLLRNGQVEKPPGGARPAYIVITADDRLSPGNGAEIDVFNTPGNARGGTVKVALINDVAAEGVSFKNVREIHMLEPWYNMHKVDQIVGRGVRFMSHAGLPTEERNVGVYLHTNVVPDTDIESIDFRRYRIALSKQHKIDQVEALLKANAVDCVLSDRATKSETRRIRDSKGERRQLRTIRDMVVCAYKSSSKNGAASSATLNHRMLLFDIVDNAKMLRGVLERNAVTHFAPIDLEREHGVASNRLLKPTLRYMVRGRMPMRINQTKGYIVRTGSSYVFQPFEVSDRKLSLRERASPLRRRVVRRFVVQPSVMKSKPASAKKSVCSAASDSEATECSRSSADARFDATRKAIRTLLEGVRLKGVDESVLDDMAADALEAEDFDELAAATDPALRRSLVRAMVMGEDYFVNLHTNKVYLLASEEPRVKEAGFKRSGEIRERIKKRLRAAREESGHSEIVGFVALNKGGVQTKVKHQTDKGSTGSACINTSTFKTDMLREFIRGYDPAAEVAKTVKRDLCRVYEYMLRKSGLFARPLEYGLLDKN